MFQVAAALNAASGAMVFAACAVSPAAVKLELR
jgi:hypothetical protein